MVEALGTTQLVAGDIAVIVIYFVIVLGFGLVASCKNRGSVSGYFLAGRSMHFIPVGASLFASNIGSGHFIGLAGSGAAGGIGIAVFEINALFVLLLLGWYFVPVYIAAGVYTMPEYLRKRFGGQRIRIYLAVLALLLSIFTKVAADLFAGAVFINVSIGWNIYWSIILLLAIAAIFTITGGLTAVIWTDFIQTFIMIIGAAILMVISFIQVGGYEGVSYLFPKAVPSVVPNDTTCGIPPEYSLHFIRPYNDSDYPWPGIIFGLFVSSVWYWCSDQVIVQRALAAKNLTHAKAGTMMAGYLKILPMWLLIVPGMISRILFPDEIGCADPDQCEIACGQRAGCTNMAYPTLVVKLMPDGLRGLMLAVMMAALMSSLTSIFNSSSTIFTMDIWRRIRKNSSDAELMIVGRVFVLFMVGIGIAWIPVVQGFSELFTYIQSITSYLAPPICAVYVLAVSWQRINEQGAFWGLMIGLVVGLIRFIWEFSYSVPACGEEDTRPAVITQVHYLHFGIILWFIVTVATIVISLLTKPIPEKCLHRLTFASRYDEEEREEIDDSEKRDVEMTGVDNQGHSISTVDVSRGNSAHYSEPDPDYDDDVPCWKTALQWICGVEKHDEPELTEEEMKAIAAKQNSLHEDPLWNKVSNVNALILMVVAVFFFAFFY